MENFIALIFDWIGENEGVLSGSVAIAVLVGLVATGVRRLTQRSQTEIVAPSEKPVAVSEIKLSESAIEQEIRYCLTSDGAHIAYAVTGEGTPIVRSLGWFTHLEVEWSSPLGRAFWQRLSRNHRLIRYDGRGMGLSESTTEFSVETRLKDLEAVVDAAELKQFALLATSEGSRTALRYAASHPDRITHLILYGSSLQIAPIETAVL